MCKNISLQKHDLRVNVLVRMDGNLIPRCGLNPPLNRVSPTASTPPTSTNRTTPRYDRPRHREHLVSAWVRLRHHQGATEAPRRPRHHRKSTTPCRHLPDDIGRLPRHHRDTMETPQKHKIAKDILNLDCHQPPRHHRNTTKTPLTHN